MRSEMKSLEWLEAQGKIAILERESDALRSQVESLTKERDEMGRVADYYCSIAEQANATIAALSQVLERIDHEEECDWLKAECPRCGDLPKGHWNGAGPLCKTKFKGLPCNCPKSASIPSRAKALMDVVERARELTETRNRYLDLFVRPHFDTERKDLLRELEGKINALSASVADLEKEK